MRDEELWTAMQARQNSPAFGLVLDDHTTLSRLWVLGAYEIVRKLDWDIDHNAFTASPAVAKLVKETKWQFSRLRMPLAKLEPEGRAGHDKTDFSYPDTIFTADGVAWGVAPTEIITRSDLSDTFLSMLQTVRREQPALNPT
jgi:hypothetical protein